MGVELPLCVVVTILECCVTFSGVKLSIRSFVLFQSLMQHPHFSKMNQPGGLLLLFSRRDVKNTENEKVFSVWKFGN